MPRRALFCVAAVAAFAAFPVAAMGLAPPVAAKTVWLCFPGHRPDPCTPGLSTTVYTPALNKSRVKHPQATPRPPIDCFYVYPTVSTQTTGNSNLAIEPVERKAARNQVGRFSPYCRAFAPMYRQETITVKPTTPPNPAIALEDVRNAFRAYLRRFNDGRGFVLIGDSQGSYVLRQLIAKDIDPKPTIRRSLVSAILLGGNVLVKQGTGIGGDFKHIGACRSASELHCVIAFSSFDQPVPNPSLFGRPVGLLGTPTPPGEVVLCINPAVLTGTGGVLDPIFPSGQLTALGPPKQKPGTVWSAVPGSYRARCSSANNAHVLQITPIRGAPLPAQTLGPAYGLHLIDEYMALGNLVEIVRRESARFVSR